MAKYIVYRLNEAGKIRHSEWIDARSDEAALAEARALNLSDGCEVWQRNRLVGRIERANGSR